MSRFPARSLSLLFAFAAAIGAQPSVPLESRPNSEGPGEPANTALHPRQENAWLRGLQRWHVMKDQDGAYDAADLLSAQEAANRMPQGAPSTPWRLLGPPAGSGGRSRAVYTGLDFVQAMVGGTSGGAYLRDLQSDPGEWQKAGIPDVPISCLIANGYSPWYIGTGDAFSGDGYAGIGIFRNTGFDDDDWEHLASTRTQDFRFVNRIAVPQSNWSRFVLAATQTGIWQSRDKGETWVRRLEGPVLDLKFSMYGTGFNLKDMVAGGWGKAWYSPDTGDTWFQAAGLPAGTGRVELAWAMADIDVIYALVDRNGGEVYRSVDKGRSYALRSTGANLLGTQGWYANAIFSTRIDADIVVAGGTRLHLSEDGGLTWRDIHHGLPDDILGLISGRYVLPAQENSLVVATGGGVFYTGEVQEVSASRPFTSLNEGLPRPALAAGAALRATRELAVGAEEKGTLGRTADTGAGSGDGGWNELEGGDGGMVAVDPAADGAGTYAWYVSRPRGGTWRLDRDSSGEVVRRTNLGTPADEGYPYVTPMALDPSGQRLYKGGYALWRLDAPRTAVEGAAWTRVKAPGTVEITAVAVAPGDGNQVWIGSRDGSVYSTANALSAAPTWTRSGAGTLPLRYCTRLVPDPAAPGRLYATFGGFRDRNVWRSEDAGATWVDVSGNLPEAPVHALAFRKEDRNRLVAATEVGVFSSGDGGTSWTQYGPFLAPTADLFWSGTRLYAATVGRGLWRTALNLSPSVALTSPADGAAFLPGSDLQLQAEASDDDKVAKVAFYQGTILLGTDEAPPYSFTWTQVPAGAHVLTAKAYDEDGGATQSAPVTISSEQATALAPSADAHVRDGASASLNFGSAATLEARSSASSGENRNAFLRFDLTSTQGLVSGAKLRLRGSVSGLPLPIQVRSVSGSWTESGITWNNSPAPGDVLATTGLLGMTPAWVEADVSRAVRAARAAGLSAVEFCVQAQGLSTGPAVFASREAAADRPELSLSTAHRSVLLVVGSASPLASGDQAMQDRLLALGLAVSIKSGSASATSDAAGHSLVIISSTVAGAGDVGTKFTEAAVPVILAEYTLQGAMGMASESGRDDSQTQVRILASQHPLAAGLSGTQTVVSSSTSFGWGKPGGSASKVAVIKNNGTNTKSTLYAYARDAAMPKGWAPARRVFLYQGDAGPANYTAAGWALFEAAVVWALEL